MNLPKELTDFLKNSNKIDIEELANMYDEALLKATLIPKEEWVVEEVKVHTQCLKNDMGIEFEKDGYFRIKYVDLLSYGNALVWYPDLQCFGQAGNSDHCFFFILKDIDFNTISQKTFKYLIGYFEWDEGADFMITGQDLAACPFEEGDDKDGWFLRV